MASTEPVYRDAYPRFLSIRRYFSWQGLRTRSFFLANVVGIALTFFFFAYQTVFYLAADKLGAWAPADVPFSDLLNTRFPWVMVLFVGFFPAVSEEIQFRAFAIPFLRKYLKSGPLAIVLPGLHLGISALGLSQSTLLHSRPGSGFWRRDHWLHHAALRDSGHADLALLRGCALYGLPFAALSQSLPHAVGRSGGGDHADPSHRGAGRVLEDRARSRRKTPF